MPEVQTTPYNLRDNDLIFADPQNEYVLRFKDIPDDERPRERLLKVGAANLSVAELMSIIWGSGTKKEDVLSMSQRTLKEYGDKTISHELNPQHLSEVADIPLVKACQIIASFELGRRFYAKQSGRTAYVRNAKQAYNHLKTMGQGR